MLKRFDLIKYAHQRVDSLSGGNKRKLCAAISMMTPVSVVLMDEPTRYFKLFKIKIPKESIKLILSLIFLLINYSF